MAIKAFSFAPGCLLVKRPSRKTLSCTSVDRFRLTKESWCCIHTIFVRVYSFDALVSQWRLVGLIICLLAIRYTSDSACECSSNRLHCIMPGRGKRSSGKGLVFAFGEDISIYLTKRKGILLVRFLLVSSINLVDPASSHTLVSKIKPCMSKYKQFCTVKLRMAHYISYSLFDSTLLLGYP